LGVGLTTLPCKKKIVQKPPRNSAEFCGGGQGLSWLWSQGKKKKKKKMWMVSFTPPQLYPQGKSPRYPLDRRLGGTQSRYGHCVEGKSSKPRQESNPDYLIVQPVAKNENILF
jgi:hypothetical protein